MDYKEEKSEHASVVCPLFIAARFAVSSSSSHDLPPASYLSYTRDTIRP